MVKRARMVKKSGPYKVLARADGSLVVIPAWPQFPKADEGGGPGFISRMGLAEDLERWLNAPYEARSGEKGS